MNLSIGKRPFALVLVFALCASALLAIGILLGPLALFLSRPRAS